KDGEVEGAAVERLARGDLQRRGGLSGSVEGAEEADEDAGAAGGHQQLEQERVEVERELTEVGRIEGVERFAGTPPEEARQEEIDEARLGGPCEGELDGGAGRDRGGARAPHAGH